MIYNYESIQAVHLEVTDKCNASCPMCARNKMGGSVNQHLPLTELSLLDIKRIFPMEFIKQLNRMYMCGNFGDPIIAKDTLEIFRHFRKLNPDMSLAMNTNGSARSEQWWKDLGAVLGENGNVKFGIDGLADTHSLYRKDTDFYKITRNARAFIKGGGMAIWEFIVFAHNEDQIVAARALSKEYGFSKFTTKKTGRFFSNIEMKTNIHQEVHGRDDKLLYTIKLPKDPSLHNQSLQKEKKLIETFGSMEKYFDQTSITCKVKKEKSLFISADGYVFPCCWLGNQMYVWYMEKQKTEIWNIINKAGGVALINAKKHSLKQIVEGPFLSEIEKSWTLESVANGKLKTCAKTCGLEFDQFGDQYK